MPGTKGSGEGLEGNEVQGASVGERPRKFPRNFGVSAGGLVSWKAGQAQTDSPPSPAYSLKSVDRGPTQPPM